MDRYALYLPITDQTPRLTLGEGGTPLVRARSLERETGVSEIWLKVEGQNPTGSFKDRGMVVAVAKALDTLAGLYEAQNKYAEAEPLLKRSLAIRQKSPGQPDVAASRSIMSRNPGRLAGR